MCGVVLEGGTLTGAAAGLVSAPSTAVRRRASSSRAGVGVWIGVGSGVVVVGALLGAEGTGRPLGARGCLPGVRGGGGCLWLRGRSGVVPPVSLHVRVVHVCGVGLGGAGGVVAGRTLRTAQWTRASFVNSGIRVLVGPPVVLPSGGAGVGLLCGQVVKGTRWMPGHQEPMKDVGGCVKPRGAANRALIRGCPNGGTPHQSCGVTRA